MIKIIKNISPLKLSFCGQDIEPGDSYMALPSEFPAFAASPELLQAIASGAVLIGNGVEFFSDPVKAADWIRGAVIKTQPTEAENVHLMQGFCIDHEFTPTPDPENPGAFLPEVKDTVLNSATHDFVRLWGVKFRVDPAAKRDRVRVQIAHSEYGVISQYAEWSPWAEGGMIQCPKPPDGASGKVPVGMIIRIEYLPTTDSARFFACNVIASIRDGEERAT